MNEWTALLAALLTPLVAFFGGYIAWRQWRTAQNRLKLHLFDRRFAIYMAAQSFINAARGGRLPTNALLEFRDAIQRAKWLMSAQVADYLKADIFDRALDLEALVSELEGVPAGDERSRNVKAQRELRHELDAQFDELDRLFAPFLKLSHH